MTGSTTVTGATANLGAGGRSTAGWMLVIGPLLAVLGSVISFVTTPDQTMTDIEQVRHGGWIAFHLLADVGVVIFVAGLALLAPQTIKDRAAAHVAQGLSWVTAGLVLLVMIIAGYAGPALASSSGTVAITDPAELALLMDLVESFGNGIFLIMGVLIGTVVLAIGAGARRTGLLSKPLATAAMALGGLAMAANLWLWITSDASDAWMFGITTSQLLLLWAIAAGTSLLRRTGRARSGAYAGA